MRTLVYGLVILYAACVGALAGAGGPTVVRDRQQQNIDADRYSACSERIMAGTTDHC